MKRVAAVCRLAIRVERPRVDSRSPAHSRHKTLKASESQLILLEAVPHESGSLNPIADEQRSQEASDPNGKAQWGRESLGNVLQIKANHR